MSTFTSSLGLEEIAPGTQAGLWGDSTNNNLNLIDQAVTGVTPLSFAGLSGTVRVLESSNGAEDEARSAVLDITGGATGANTVVVPNKQKTYLVRNFTGQQITFRTATPNAPAVIPSGNNTLIFCDGNNNVFPGIVTESVGPTQISGGGTGVTTYAVGDTLFYASGTTLSRLPIGVAGYILTSSGTAPQWSAGINVVNGGTGRATLASGALLTGDGTNPIGTIVGSANGQVLTYNGSSWVGRASGLGAGNFTNTNITVDAQGQITAISNGSSSGGVTSIGVTAPITSSGPSTSPTIAISSTPTFTAVNIANTNNRIQQDTAGEIQFYANGIGSAKVTANGVGALNFAATGRALIGTSGGGAGSNFNLDVTGQPNQTVAFITTTGSGGNGMSINAVNTQSCILFSNNGTFNGSITVNGVNTFYNTTSDRRLKSDIVDLTDSGSVIDALQPREFVWNATGEKTAGFIADELQQVMPTAVQGQPNEVDEDGNPKYQAVDASTSEMIAVMVAELQSLRKRVAELEAK